MINNSNLFIGSLLKNKLFSRSKKQNEKAKSRHIKGELFGLCINFANFGNEQRGTDVVIFLHGRELCVIVFLSFSHTKI